MLGSEGVGLCGRKNDFGIAQAANECVVRALRFQQIFLLDGERMKKFSIAHLSHDVGIALVCADEERDFAEFDRACGGGKEGSGREDCDDKNVPAIWFHSRWF